MCRKKKAKKDVTDVTATCCYSLLLLLYLLCIFVPALMIMDMLLVTLPTATPTPLVSQGRFGGAI